MNKLRVAVVGVGAMGKSHARVYSSSENVQLVAVCDSNKDASNEIASKYNSKAYFDFKEMFSKEKLDAVSISVPTKFHHEVALCAMSYKINCLVEKPIAKTPQEAISMIKSQKQNGVVLMIGHIERFNPVVVELKKRIGKNELGKIYKVHCSRQSPFPQRILDVGVIIDLAIHEIDMLNYLLESKPTRVYAETARRIHSSQEDLLVGTLRFENDVLGVINANWLTPKKIREISVIGEKGMFVANYLTQELDFYENEFAAKNLNYDRSFMNVIQGKKESIKIENSEPLKNELDAFAQCILDDKVPLVTGAEGMDALIIAEKFLESSVKKKVIEL